MATRSRRNRRSSTSAISEQEKLVRKREQNRVAQQTYRRAQKERMQALEAAVARSAKTWARAENDILGDQILVSAPATASTSATTTSISSGHTTHGLCEPLLDMDLGLGLGQDCRLSSNLANNNDCPTSCIDHVIGNDEPQSDNANTLPNLMAAVTTANNALSSPPLIHHHDHDGEEHLQAKGAPTEAPGDGLTGVTGNPDGSLMYKEAEVAAMSLQEIGGWVWNSPLDDYTAHHDAGNGSDSTSVHTSSEHCRTRNTALHIAALAGDSRMVELLLERGADAGLLNGDGQGPLHLAVMAAAEGEQGLGGQTTNSSSPSRTEESKKIIRLLLQALATGTNCSHPGLLDRSGRSLLFTAITTGSEAVVQMVLNAVGDAAIAATAAWADRSSNSGSYSDGNEPHDSVRQAGIKAVLEEPDARGVLPLHIAAASGSASIVMLLLSNGVDINQ